MPQALYSDLKFLCDCAPGQLVFDPEPEQKSELRIGLVAKRPAGSANNIGCILYLTAGIGKTARPLYREYFESRPVFTFSRRDYQFRGVKATIRGNRKVVRHGVLLLHQEDWCLCVRIGIQYRIFSTREAAFVSSLPYSATVSFDDWLLYFPALQDGGEQMITYWRAQRRVYKHLNKI